MTDAAARLLHVANGTSTTATMAAAGIPGIRSIWADPLYEGPVPAGLTDTELLDVRRRYLAAPGDLTSAARGGDDPSRDPVNDLRQWRAVLERRDAYDEIVLWFEHDLFDQLNLIQLLTWIRDHLPATQPVSLICIGSFPGRPAFKGLGELTPGELASLLETRQPVGDAEFEVARRAWQAFREPTPEPLDRLRLEDTSPLPFVAPAMTRWLEEYPWTRDGLSRTERRLLELADGDGSALSQAFPRMHDGERFYHVTDGTLAGLAETLSRTPHPLLRFDQARDAGGSGLRRTVALTAIGRSVLAGRLDRIATCGIDRWLGGVHLHGQAPLWRWDPERQRVVR